MLKKFVNYTTVAYSAIDSPGSDQSSSAVEDAREAFLLELSSFSLQLKKAVMVCEAEARQVEEYYRERQRIGGWQHTVSEVAIAHPDGCSVQRMSMVHLRAKSNNSKRPWSMPKWKESEKSNTIVLLRRLILFLVAQSWSGEIFEPTAIPHSC
jgi:hypothetical protein